MQPNLQEKKLVLEQLKKRAKLLEFNENEKDKILEEHIRPALQSLSLWDDGEQFFQLCKTYWKEFSSLKLKQPQLKINPRVVSINLEKKEIGIQGCQILAKTNWINLNELKLRRNKVGNKGIGYLARANWPNLETLDLMSNNIGNEGCYNLTKGDWANLKTLYLMDNYINSEGLNHLSKSNWKNFQKLQMIQNVVGDEAILYMMKSNWPNINIIRAGTMQSIIMMDELSIWMMNRYPNMGR